jgi:hypothetical protein
MMRFKCTHESSKEAAMTPFRHRASVAGFLCVAAALTCAAALTACGGASTSASESPSPSALASSPAPTGPTPLPSPQITSGRPPSGAIAVVRRYWTLLGAHKYDAAFALATGPHISNASTEPKEFESLHYLRPASKVYPSPGSDATVEFGSWVYIVPTATSSPFGTAAARWQLFSRVVRMSDGSWRLVEVGTGE